jgi:nucleotide-binding universal stress UspA family protein
VLILHASTAAESAAGRPAADARAAAEIVAGQSADHPDVCTDYLFVLGETVPALVDASSEASMLVLGRPGSQRGRRVWRHSVAGAMLHQARCPLVVLPPRTGPADVADGRRSGTRVLVA